MTAPWRPPPPRRVPHTPAHPRGTLLATRTGWLCSSIRAPRRALGGVGLHNRQFRVVGPHDNTDESIEGILNKTLS